MVVNIYFILLLLLLFFWYPTVLIEPHQGSQSGRRVAYKLKFTKSKPTRIEQSLSSTLQTSKWS